MRSSYDGPLSRGSAGLNLPGINPASSAHPNGADRKCPIPRLDRCSDGSNVDGLCSAARSEGSHPVTASIQEIATMLNSRLRNCFDINVFSNLGRCIKWG